jgi:hypothetical protein
MVSILLPAEFDGHGVGGVIVDGQAAEATAFTVAGRPMQLIGVQGGKHTFAVDYNAQAPTPAPMPTAVATAAAAAAPAAAASPVPATATPAADPTAAIESISTPPIVGAIILMIGVLDFVAALSRFGPK